MGNRRILLPLLLPSIFLSEVLQLRPNMAPSLESPSPLCGPSQTKHVISLLSGMSNCTRLLASWCFSFVFRTSGGSSPYLILHCHNFHYLLQVNVLIFRSRQLYDIEALYASVFLLKLIRQRGNATTANSRKADHGQ